MYLYMYSVSSKVFSIQLFLGIRQPTSAGIREQ